MENKNIFGQMTEDDFYNAITNPLFWFMDLENRASDDKEELKAQADSFREVFRKRYYEEFHNGNYEQLFIYFAFGFDAAMKVVDRIINGRGADNE